MDQARLFTEEELAEMGTPTVELLQAAIDAGDKARAKELTSRMHLETLYQHDAYRDWITALLSFIGRRYGDEVLEEALRDSCGMWFRPVVGYLDGCKKEGKLRQGIKMFARGLRQHLTPTKIEEDEEKFVFTCDPCGSGGRLIADGGYEPPTEFLKVSTPQPMTYGQENLPVYCTHGAILAMLSIEWTGSPVFFEDPSDDVGTTPCKFYIYKDPQATPAHLYAKVGKKKGGSGDTV